MKAKTVDLLERAAATFAQAFLAAVVVGTVTDWKALELALVAGGMAVAKYVLVVANAYLGNPPTSNAGKP